MSGNVREFSGYGQEITGNGKEMSRNGQEMSGIGQEMPRNGQETRQSKLCKTLRGPLDSGHFMLHDALMMR